MTNKDSKVIALIEWSHLIEDFLDNIGLSLEDFKTKMSGGWLFGYIEALKTSGIDTVLFCFSAKTHTPLRFTHAPTGARVCVLPAGKIYRSIRRIIVNPYAATVDEAAINAKGWRRSWYSFLLKVAPYFATPIRCLYREIKRLKCTAVICQDYEHARFDACVLMGKMLGIPVFASFQGGNWQMSPYEKWFRRFSLKACAGLIIASKREAERVNTKYNIAPGKIARIFNPVDMLLCEGISKEEARKKNNINADNRVAIWHGRVDYHRKGLDTLISAWEKICSDSGWENKELILLGTGVNACMLQERLASSPVRNIRWINEYINDRPVIYSYLRSADFYVFPSRNEGFPVAPLEAMACGLPVIAADAPGIEDIFNEGAGGIVLKRGDTLAFAATMSGWLHQKSITDKMGKDATENIRQNFSLQAVGAQLNNLIFHDLSNKPDE